MILYGRKIWVVTEVMMTVIEVFHHRIDRRIAGMTVMKGDGRECDWELMDTALETTWI